MDAKIFYKNLKQEDIKPLEEVVKILKEDSRVDVFAINKAAEQNHCMGYEAIHLLLRGFHKTDYHSSINKIKELGAKIHEDKVETIEGKPNYDAFVTDKMIKEVNIKFINATEIRLFYTINGTGVSPKIRL